MTKDITIQLVYAIYDKLFTHLERSIGKLKKKQSPWKQSMVEALKASKSKLSEYYSRTIERFGDRYAAATILSPLNKLEFFESSSWEGNYQVEYHKKIQAMYDASYSHIAFNGSGPIRPMV